MSGSRGKQEEPPVDPEQAFDDQTADGVAASLRRRSQRNRQSQPESGDVEPVEQSPTMQPAKRTKREKLNTESAPVETPVPKASGSIAEATLVGPLRESMEREKIKSAAHKAALLNPPRQQEPAQPEVDPAADPAKRAELYNTAALRMQSTLDSLQHRTKRYNSSVSVNDLEVLHNQFGEFMYYHPIFSPAAQREAAANTGMPVPPYVVEPSRGLSGAGAAPVKKRRGRKPKARPAAIPPVPRFAEPICVPKPPADAWQSMHSSQATEIAVPLQYAYDPSTEPYVYNYQPEPEPAYAEEMPAAAQPWPGQTDSQAIEQATQAMAGNQNVVQGDIDGQTALQLLHVLSHFVQTARAEPQPEPLQAEPRLPDTDRFAASTLMALNNRTPNEYQQQQQQQEPAPPSIDSFDPGLFSLLMQRLQHESGGPSQGQY